MSGQGPAFRLPIQVQFRDCDAVGHVNHAVYLSYMEQCRLMFWRSLTGSPFPLARVVVVHAECDYKASAFFGDELEVRLYLGNIGRSSFVLTYEIENAATRTVIAAGKTVMVTYDEVTRKAIPIPEATRKLLEAQGSIDD